MSIELRKSDSGTYRQTICINQYTIIFQRVSAMRFAALFVTALLLAACNTLSLPHAQAAEAAATGDVYGHIDSETLLAQYPQFASEYQRYQPSAEELQQMQQLKGLQLVVLFGSWCHDSEREVPRLLKLVQQSGVALAAVKLEGVNQQKQHPQNLQTTYGLRYTPTIIVLRDGTELGRVIEQPKQTLAADLASFVN